MFLFFSNLKSERVQALFSVHAIGIKVIPERETTTYSQKFPMNEEVT
jgi:hypothetical protein